ncbi:hypothetical protein Tco_0450598 [Tanacetum coccineum]
MGSQPLRVRSPIPSGNHTAAASPWQPHAPPTRHHTPPSSLSPHHHHPHAITATAAAASPWQSPCITTDTITSTISSLAPPHLYHHHNLYSLTSSPSLPPLAAAIAIGEIITPEELNLKFLRSLPTEWDVEPEVKRSVLSAHNSGSQICPVVSGWDHFARRVYRLELDLIGWEYIWLADEEASTNFALMAFSDSESVEERLVFYKKNERMLCDQIVVLKNDASFNESDINALKKQVERLKKEKEEKRYNAVPPHPSIDLSNSGLEKFKQPEFEGYGVKVNKDVSENVSKEVKKNSDAPIIEDWVSDCDEDETVVLESLNVQKPKQADQPRKVSQNPRNNSTSWNTPMPKKLGVGFQFTPKACFVCGSFNHLIKDCDFHDKRMVQKPVLNNVKKGTGQREVRPVWTNAMRVNHQKISNSRRNFAPTAVLTKSGLVPFSTARENFSRTAAPVSAARPFNTAVPSVNVAYQKNDSENNDESFEI